MLQRLFDGLVGRLVFIVVSGGNSKYVGPLGCPRKLVNG